MGALLIVVIFVIIALFSVLDFNSPNAKGNMGETYMRNMLNRHLSKDVYYCMNDVFLSDDQGGTTQVDHIVISIYGIFVIETKNYKGWIFGSLDSKKWKQVNFQKKNYFNNPLRQNYKHTKVISECTSIPMSCIFSIVAFVGDAEFKGHNKPNNVLMNPMDVIGYIKSRKRQIFPEEEAVMIKEYLEKIALPKDRKTKSFHINYLHNKKW